VDLWQEQVDVYTDRIFFKHSITGVVTFDRPGLEHYLPATFSIPAVLPTATSILENMESSSDSSSDSSASVQSLSEWQSKYGKNRNQLNQDLEDGEKKKRKENTRKKKMLERERREQKIVVGRDDSDSIGESSNSDDTDNEDRNSDSSSNEDEEEKKGDDAISPNNIPALMNSHQPSSAVTIRDIVDDSNTLKLPPVPGAAKRDVPAGVASSTVEEVPVTPFMRAVAWARDMLHSSLYKQIMRKQALTAKRKVAKEHRSGRNAVATGGSEVREQLEENFDVEVSVMDLPAEGVGMSFYL
jgi:hypothetical protein